METPFLSGQAGERDIRKTADALSDKAAEGIGQWSESAHKAVDRVGDTMTSTARQIGETGSDWLMAQRRWTEASRVCVRRHPIASVAIALAVGAVLSRLSSNSGSPPE